MNVACVTDSESGCIDLGEVFGERGQIEKTSCDTLIVTYSTALARIHVAVVFWFGAPRTEQEEVESSNEGDHKVEGRARQAEVLLRSKHDGGLSWSSGQLDSEVKRKEEEHKQDKRVK